LRISERMKVGRPENIERVIEILKESLGKKISTREVDLVSYSHDYWPITLHWLIKGEVPALPDAIVWPESTEEVQLVVRTAHELNVPVYPYGGGSGVLGGTVPERGGIVVDLKRIRDVVLNEKDLIVEAGAGVNGYYLEKYL